MSANPVRCACLVTTAILLGSFLAAGCARPRGPLFDRPSKELVWPAPPAPPRIRYVGALRHAGDLHSGRTFLEGMGDVLFGKEKPPALYGPRSVLCTPDGRRVWISDPGGRCLHLFDLANREYRKVLHVNGTRLIAPAGVCLGPSGSFYVTDTEAAAIYRLNDVDGSLLDTLQISGDVHRPVDLWYDAKQEFLYVVDTVSHDIKVMNRGGKVIKVLGGRGTAPGRFNFPTSVDGGGGRLWVADSGNRRVQGLTYNGRPLIIIGKAGDAPGDLALPKGVAVDYAGRVYVVDARFENIQIFDDRGRLLLYLGDEGTDYGEFWLPADLFIDSNGRIWVCDMYNHRIQVFAIIDNEYES